MNATLKGKWFKTNSGRRIFVETIYDVAQEYRAACELDQNNVPIKGTRIDYGNGWRCAPSKDVAIDFAMEKGWSLEIESGVAA